ncbi:MAG: septal ring lytic transglycosylase RlpA family protein [Cyanobacteriota bacterium]|nr:septal ring lytic transglycosylase RlpA family protein [Cyanobacteriota bacterium]
MNQRLLLTFVAVISTVVGTPSISRAQAVNEPLITSQKSSEKETLTEKNNGSNTAVTKIYAHKLADRQAATLYIRNIPVFTFLSSVSAATPKSAVNTDSNYSDPVEKANSVAAKINNLVNNKVDASKITVSWNGTTQSKSGAKTLDERYAIKVNGSELIEINSNTILPDATKNLRQDALQATNRLRRLLGKASPLKTIAGLPPELTKPKKQAVKTEQTTANKHHTKKWRKRRVAARGGRRFRGIASFYGAYFAGRKTASGERFNPSKMTAAHKTLPFGTRVRVTNMRNGRSVVVRINDRGPFIRGRVIDLSRGAAGVIGMIGRGIAPVRVEVLGR